MEDDKTYMYVRLPDLDISKHEKIYFGTVTLDDCNYFRRDVRKSRFWDVQCSNL
jgi:hypothetical protein